MNIVSVKKKNKVLVSDVMHAKNVWHRFRGLIARKKLKKDQGMLLTPCSSVHTIGMTYDLDLIFLNKEGVVMRCIDNVKPFRFAMSSKAKHTLELSSGTIAKLGIKEGDKLSWN